MQELYDNLLLQLVEIERKLADMNLTHSDKQLLDQVWEDVTDEIDEVEQVLGMPQEMSVEEALMWNKITDDREGCDQCVGCMFCLETETYDPAGEV